jgi:hypothetical protein
MLTLARVADTAGKTPNTKTVSSATAAVKASTRASG